MKSWIAVLLAVMMLIVSPLAGCAPGEAEEPEADPDPAEEQQEEEFYQVAF